MTLIKRIRELTLVAAMQSHEDLTTKEHIQNLKTIAKDTYRESINAGSKIPTFKAGFNAGIYELAATIIRIPPLSKSYVDRSLDPEPVVRERTQPIPDPKSVSIDYSRR